MNPGLALSLSYPSAMHAAPAYSNIVPSAHRDRLNEIRVLKIKLNDLKRELHILKSSVANIDVLKREVHQLGRELLQERTKVGSLGLGPTRNG